VRLAVIVSVLTCLCFSVGEGVRLFPFHVQALEAGETFSFVDNFRLPYSPSLHRFGSHRLEQSAKTKKNISNESHQRAHASGFGFAGCIQFNARLSFPEYEVTVYHLQILFNNVTDRSPPAGLVKRLLFSLPSY
jgi:hypothetical protein